MHLAPLLSLCLLATATLRGQGRYYVSEGASGDGSSWASASGDLAGLMAEAVTGTEIWVAAGTYYPTTCLGDCSPADRLATFRLRPGVRVAGGFVGGETEVTAADAGNVTVLSGDIGRPGDPGDNAHAVVTCRGCGTAASLANLTITGGKADRAGVGPTAHGAAGAGLYLVGVAGRPASPTLTSCAIVDNDSRGYGGGAFLDGGGAAASPRFVDCLFAYNTAGAGGGGACVHAPSGVSSPSFTGTTFRDNGTVVPATRGMARERAAGTQAGGGLYVEATDGRADVRLTRCLLTGNRTDVSLAGRPFANAAADGGAVYLTSATTNPELRLTAENTVFSHNSAYSGGAVYNHGGVTRLAHATVVGNDALGRGGAGGGVYLNGASATVANAVFADNRAAGTDDHAAGAESGGADFRFVNGTLEIEHTLLAADSREAAFSRASLTRAADAYHEGAGVRYGLDPRFVDPAAEVPELQATSPGLDAGHAAVAVADGIDYRGAARTYGPAPDLGAVERRGLAAPAEVVDFRAAPTDGGVRVRWASVSEHELHGYRVLRRGSAEAAFTSVGEVLAMGAGAYGYTDRSALPGGAYEYRLRGIDAARETDLSPAATVHLGEDVHPNEDEVTLGSVVEWVGGREVTVVVRARARARTVYATLFDADGTKVRLWPLTTDGPHALSLADVPDGRYVLRLTEAGGAAPRTFAIDHFRVGVPAEAPGL